MMTEAEAKKVREEILEIFTELSSENQQIFLKYARIAYADEDSIKNVLNHA